MLNTPHICSISDTSNAKRFGEFDLIILLHSCYNDVWYNMLFHTADYDTLKMSIIIEKIWMCNGWVSFLDILVLLCLIQHTIPLCGNLRSHVANGVSWFVERQLSAGIIIIIIIIYCLYSANNIKIIHDT